jgi:hypothetical protein
MRYLLIRCCRDWEECVVGSYEMGLGFVLMLATYAMGAYALFSGWLSAAGFPTTSLLKFRLSFLS